MIHAVLCDKPQFKTVTFKPGFNVVLAERRKESTEKDSRNGLGKTTLIEIIHFCLGGDKGQVLQQEKLHGWTFSLEIDLRGNRYTIHRNTEKSSYVVIAGDWSLWPIQPSIDETTREPFLKLPDWKTVLGWLLFNLPVLAKKRKFYPTFRTLIPYFIRRGQDAYSDPFEHHRKQLGWEKQVNNAFLLDLGWEYAHKWQVLKEQADALGKLKQVAQTGLMSDLLGQRGELETAKVRLEEQVANEEKQLTTFKVHPQYREIEQTANSLTEKIHELSNENVRSRRIVGFYENSLNGEQASGQDRIAEVYEEAGVAFPGSIRKRLEDVQQFHSLVITNRQKFLEREIRRLKNNLARRERRIHDFSEERASVLSILKTHGALEEYTKLQRSHLQTSSRLEEIRRKLRNLKAFEKKKSAIRIDQEHLLLDALADDDERQSVKERAISLYNHNTERLYESPGKLLIDINKTGFKFQVEIERSSSQGVGHMKVFSYDLMLVQLWSGKTIGPDFLVHDSMIFDGVDERQVASSLQLAAEEAKRLNFQYICCLNSDMIPWSDFDEEFNLKDYVRLTLTDAEEDGGLLGMRF